MEADGVAPDDVGSFITSLIAYARGGPSLHAVASQRERALLRYALKLTLRPKEMQPADITALRQVGFVDADILGLCEVVAYYAYANRIADGLGITIEPWTGSDP